MKTFRFRLDQALRWRATQVDIEKTRLALAATECRQIREGIDVRRAELTAGSMQLSAGNQAGDTFAHWGAFTDQSRRHLAELEVKARQAERNFATQTEALVAANRRLQLLENLKEREHSRWQAACDRELEAFADESYLFRLQLEGKRARSSGG